MKKLAFLVVTVMVMVLAMAVPVMAAPEASVLNVPGDYSTIQAAIDAASDGDTIIVAAGSYPENIVINKDITLFGAKCGIDAAGNTDRGGESIIVGGQVEITAAGATINGFKLEGNRIFINGAADVTVSYNIIENSSMHGIRLDSFSPNANIVYNTISNPNWEGICNYVGNSGVEISHNHIDGITVGHAIVSGMHVGTDIKITHNVISDCANKGINYWGAPGAVINHNVISDTGDDAIFTDTQATIVGNVISGSLLNGITLYPGTDKSTVTNNEISDCGGDGILLYGSDVSVVNNTISGCNWGIIVTDFSNGNRIINNDISGCYVGVGIFGNNNKVINNDISECDYDVYALGENNKVHNN